MSGSGVCSIEGTRTSYNQANSSVDAAKNTFQASKLAYQSCLADRDRPTLVSQLIGETEADRVSIRDQSITIDTMSSFILKQLRRESGVDGGLNALNNLAEETSTGLESQIDQLKSSIRTERRRFLDASPSESTGIGGLLFFTQEPDNNLIIIFLGCLGALLVAMTLIIVNNQLPLAMLQNSAPGSAGSQNYMLVAAMWIGTIVLTLVGFFTFT